MHERVLVPTDGSPTARRAIDQAAARAVADGAKLVLMTVTADVPTARTGLDEEAIAAQLREGAESLLEEERTRITSEGVRIETAIRQGGDVAREILAEADDQQADLIMMGTHGRSGLRRFLIGSVTERVLRRARRPVLVVPPGERG
jgi:nucleotide-binding universal stress UspA family protein